MARPFNLEAFVWATGAFCQLNRIPHDPALLIKQFPPPYDLVNLQQALQSFGFNHSLKQYALHQLPNASLPCLALIKPLPQSDLTSTVSDSSSSSHTDNQPASTEPVLDPLADLEQSAPNQVTDIYGIALILRRDDQRLLVIRPGQTEPITIGIDEFAKQVTGEFLMVRKAEETVAEDGSTVSAINAGTGKTSSSANQDQSSSVNKADKEFGFRWFVPELLKYKRIWSEVLTASLAIQLVGLAVPICTQIVIDKVVVHHTTSTLI